MKFACPKCSARYSVGEDKIPPHKVLRFTCKKCGHVIRLKRRPTGSPVATDSPVLASRSAGAVAAPPPVPEASLEDTSSAEWFVLKDGQQLGPWTRQALVENLARQEINDQTFVWRDGMAEWQRLGEVHELAALSSANGHDANSPWVAPPALPGSSANPALKNAAKNNPVPDARGVEEDDSPTYVDANATTAPDTGPDYFQAPPGEATRLFMATAGIFKRRRNNRIAAGVAALAVAALGVLIYGDVTGLYQIPGMGFVYEATGINDPNVGRAIERTERKLSRSDITDAERQALRDKLLGLAPPRSRRGKARRQRGPIAAPTVGIAGSKALAASDRSLAASVFADTRKQEAKVALKAPEAIQTPNLPQGLTQEAIIEVIERNYGSMRLCIAESLKKGEKLSGRMDVELTIVATGAVTDVLLPAVRFRNTAMGNCTQRTMKRWRFPRFNGEPVPVAFPFVLSAGM